MLIPTLVLIAVIMILSYPRQRAADNEGIEGIVLIEKMQCEIVNEYLLVSLSALNKTYYTIKDATMRITAWSGNNRQVVVIPVNRWNMMERLEFNKKLSTQMKSVDACAIKVFDSDGQQLTVSYW